MKNIENIDELRKIKENGPIRINGRKEIVMGVFPDSLITYREISDRIHVIEYKLGKEFIDPELGSVSKYPTSDHQKLKKAIDPYNE